MSSNLSQPRRQPARAAGSIELTVNDHVTLIGTAMDRAGDAPLGDAGCSVGRAFAQDCSTSVVQGTAAKRVGVGTTDHPLLGFGFVPPSRDLAVLGK